MKHMNYWRIMKMTAVMLCLLIWTTTETSVKNKKGRKNVLTEIRNFPSGAIDKYMHRGGKAYVRGRLINGNGERAENLVLSTTNNFTGETTELLVRVDSDGTFSQVVQLPHSCHVLQTDLNRTFFLAVDDTVGITVDCSEETIANAEGNGVKFVYVTFIDERNNPREACERFVRENDIKGDFVFLTQAEWNFLQQKLQFDATPFNLIIDRKGQTWERKVGRVTTSMLREAMNK